MGDLAARMNGTGNVSAAIVGMGNLSGNLSGGGSITNANLAAGRNLSATLGGSGSFTSADMRGKGNLSASIVIGAQPSAFDIAQSVWQGQASGYMNTGTMGRRLNDAGGSGDPWSTSTESYTDASTFGGFVKKLLTISKFLGLK